jgi:hypothetical protein
MNFKGEAMPNEETVTIEHDVRKLKNQQPLRKLFLFDVLKDPDSRPVFYWAGAMLLAGMLIFHFLEGWSYLDALYFCVISATTIGYGDFVPTTPLAKIFAILYNINAIVMLLAIFDRVRIVRSRKNSPSN